MDMNLEHNGVENVCDTESKDLENVWKLFSANKKRTFVAVQISPAVRVAIGEKLGLYRGEDGIGKVATALIALGADVVVDAAIASDALVLMRVKTLLERKEAGKGLPLFSSECTAWIEHAKRNYPEIAEDLLPTATTVCAKLLKKYYAEEFPTKKIRVIALEMGAVKKADPGVDVVLTLDELGELLQSTEANIRLMKKTPLATPFGVGSGAGYISAASGGDAEALARCLVKDKTQNTFRKFEYSGLYGKQERREATLTLDGVEWKFAVVDSLQAADELIAQLQAGEATYDYVEVAACAGGCVGAGCTLSNEEEERTRRLRKLGLKYLDFARAARSADGSAAAAVLVKNWNALCRKGEAAAFDLIDEIVDDPEEIEEEPVLEEVAEDVVIEEAAEEPVVEAISEETAVEEGAEETAFEEVAEEPAEEETVEKTEEEPAEEETAEESVVEEPAPVAEETEEVAEEVTPVEGQEETVAVEEAVEEAPVVEEAAETVEEVSEEAEEVAEEVTPVEETVIEELEGSAEAVQEEALEETETTFVEEEIAVAESAEEKLEAVEIAYEEVTDEEDTEIFEEEIASAEAVAVYEEEATEAVEEEAADVEGAAEAEETSVFEEVQPEAVEETEEAEEIPVTKVSAEELAEEIKHVEELLGVAEEDLTEAQKLARAHYYRRLSTRDRRKLKRQRRNRK